MSLPRDERARLRARTIRHWNDVFSGGDAKVIASSTGNPQLDAGLDWLCEGANSVLDFGCGNGSVLGKCALRGASHIVGIDLSEQAIAHAPSLALVNGWTDAAFHEGDGAILHTLTDHAFDAAILWNILDNMPPEESQDVLSSVHRILRPGGRLLVKLNPYITQEQQAAWNIRVIDGDLLDDGLCLWNQQTPAWDAFLSGLFTIEAFETVDYPEHETTNRMYRLAAK